MMTMRYLILAGLLALLPALAWGQDQEPPTPTEGERHRGVPSNQDSAALKLVQEALKNPTPPEEAYYQYDEDTGSYVPRNAPLRGEVARITYQQARCGVCELDIKGPLPNTFGEFAGIDHDFYVHRIGKVSVQCDVWTCPNCGLSLLINDFGMPMGEEARQFVRDRLQPRIREWIGEELGGLDQQIKRIDANENLSAEEKNQLIEQNYLSFARVIDLTDIPDHLKYELALKFYQASGAPALVLAQLNHGLVHAYRRAVCAPVNDSLLTADVRHVDRLMAEGLKDDLTGEPETEAGVLLQQAKQVLRPRANILTPVQRMILRIRCAAMYDRMGDLDAAADELEIAIGHVREMGLQGKRLERVMEVPKGRLKLLKKEYAAMREFLRHVRTALLEGDYAIDPEQLPEHLRKSFDLRQEYGRRSYLIGEFMRRVKDHDLALKWLSVAWRLSDEEVLREWIVSRVQLPDMKNAQLEAGDEEIIERVFADAGLEEDDTDLAAATDEIRAVATGAARVARVADAGAKTSGETQQDAGHAAARRLAFNGTPETAEEVLQRIWQGLSAWKQDHEGQWPATFEDLVTGGYLTRDAVNDFRDPKSGVGFVLSASGVGRGLPVVFSRSLKQCPWILQPDGVVKKYK